jgi:hypothetical protein
MIDIAKIVESPELAKNLRLELTAADLLLFASSLMEQSKKQGKDARTQDERLLTREETARVLGVKAMTTLWSWKGKDGQLQPVKIGRRIYYKWSDIQKKINNI